MALLQPRKGLGMTEIIAHSIQYLNKIDSPVLEVADEWKSVFGVGSPVPASGIYRCIGCGHEITSNKGDNFHPRTKLGPATCTHQPFSRG